MLKFEKKIRRQKVNLQAVFLVLVSVRDGFDPKAGRIKSVKNPNDSIENGTSNLPASSSVPQTAVLPRTPQSKYRIIFYMLIKLCSCVIKWGSTVMQCADRV